MANMRTRLHKQARKNTCGPAALRTVLDLQLGINVSEEALEAHGTDAETPILKHGSGTAQIRAMVRGVNRTHNTGRPWRFRVHASATVADLATELAAGRYPIVRMYEPNDAAEYHFIVVLAVTDTHVTFFDPDPISRHGPTQLSIDAFDLWWCGDGETSWYGVITSRRKLV